MTNKFWIVWSSLKGKPMVSHDTMAGAVEEAQRLCKKEGVEFFIMEAVGSVVQREIPVEFMPIHTNQH